MTLLYLSNYIQYTSLTPDKILNSLVYRTLFYVNIYGSCKLLKQSAFWLTLYIIVRPKTSWADLICRTHQ